eukprot:872904-Pyramimonas_sp.AAC.1
MFGRLSGSVSREGPNEKYPVRPMIHEITLHSILYCIKLSFCTPTSPPTTATPHPRAKGGGPRLELKGVQFIKK